jgi:hypothetical protein
MWNTGWITDDVFLSGRISMDLMLMWTHNISITAEIGMDADYIKIHRCNNMTILGQIKAREKQIESIKAEHSGNIPDYQSFDYGIYQSYERDLPALRNLQRLLLVQSN